MKKTDVSSPSANRLNAVADHFGWTPLQLAGILGISQTKAYDTLAARSSITVAMINILYTVYKVNPSFFFVAKAPMFIKNSKPADDEIRVISPASIKQAEEHIAEATRHIQALKKIL